MRSMADQLSDLRVRAARGGAIDVDYPRAADDAHAGQIIVIDDALEQPEDYLRYALNRPFDSVKIGPVTFHGIGECQNPRLRRRIEQDYPSAIPTLTFFRQSPEGQVEPNYIHTDRDMGAWTGILYMTPHPPHGDGTTFWRHRATNACASTATDLDTLREEWMDWRTLDRWEPWHTVEAKFNRLLLFSAPLFHSRALRENYGHGAGARLIQLVFGVGELQ